METLSNAAVPVMAASAKKTNNTTFMGRPSPNSRCPEIAGFGLFGGFLALPIVDSRRALPAGNYSSRGHLTIAARSRPSFLFGAYAKLPPIFA
jgi:hypothetical protein